MSPYQLQCLALLEESMHHWTKLGQTKVHNARCNYRDGLLTFPRHRTTTNTTI